MSRMKGMHYGNNSLVLERIRDNLFEISNLSGLGTAGSEERDQESITECRDLMA